ncbi:L,D-transpeptidase family protein [Streptomyces sp. SYP-A7185]|uniref:L,D-transpeptidase family protein n=1 Tax=Streptomyces sp. SYP-A7185 TaxID=3040076 RepID=UPI0038F7BA5A
MRPTVRSQLFPALAVACCLLTVGCASTPPATDKHRATMHFPAGVTGRAGPGGQAAGAIPGLGPQTRAQIPDDSRQVLVVSGNPETTTSHASATLYTRTGKADWLRLVGPWPARNAVDGWTLDHEAGDLRSPIGVFTLGDAGGLLPNPGTKLPYDQDEEFREAGTGFYGESLEGTFDYVLAIDYNRRPGFSPLDKVRPLGEEKGGGLWVHVDHEGPTNGCVALPRSQMRQLLRLLDPQDRPVIVMGPAPELLR